mgnify:CR=1 FL=1
MTLTPAADSSNRFAPAPVPVRRYTAGECFGASGVPAFLTAPPVRFPDEDELDSARETTTRSNSSSNDGRGRARGDAYAVVDVGEGGSESESEDDDGLDEDGRFRYHIV